MDLDDDGRNDMISGCASGEVYFFRRNADGTFAESEQLKDRDGKVINAGGVSAPFAVDWDGNGSLDLLIGTLAGEIHFFPKESKGTQLAFGVSRCLQAAGQPIKIESGDAAPVAADWDGDGNLDLLCGAGDGSVVWFRNTGSNREPKLGPALSLVGKSPIGTNNDDHRKPGDWGQKAKLCVVDWNGDGRLDLLLGDECGSFRAKPTQTAEEAAEERAATEKLPVVRKKWAAAFQRYRREKDPGRQDELREQVRRLKDEIAGAQEVQGRYQPIYQSHGFVWLFLLKPAADSQTASPERRQP